MKNVMKLFELLETRNWLVELLQCNSVVQELPGRFYCECFWRICHFTFLSVLLSTCSSLVSG